MTSEFIDLSEMPDVKIDLRYSSSNNFIGRPFYPAHFTKALLHPHAFEKLRKAIQNLKNKKPDWGFLIYDALRPPSAQRIMWEFVKGTPQQIYVADPAIGSLHSFGMAIDLSLVDEQGNEVDMGTEFDSFEELAQPRHERRFFNAGLLSQTQFENRLVLRSSMLEAGFEMIQHEWWHFNAAPGDFVRANYTLMEE